MLDHTQVAVSTRERFMQLAKEEMSAFERREMEFRKQEREERATLLHLPVHMDETH